MMQAYLVALAVVILMAAGQLIFKAVANSANDTGSYFATKTLVLLCSGMGLYVLTTLLWIYVLQKIELGKVYPLMALAFVFVPIASKYAFGESFSPSYYFGIVLIMSGIYFCVKV